MDSKDPKISPEKYAEMIREAKKRKDVSQGRTIPEPVGKWLESRGIDVDTLLRLEPLLKKYDSLSDEQKKRFLELKDFEPNPGKAELNEIGKTSYPVFGDMGGAPIYQEDIDMLRKSLPLVKKLLEIQRRKSRLDDTSLLTGPDTTENIKEVYEIDDEGMRPAEKYTPGKDYIYAPLAGLKPEEEEHYKKLFADMENYGDMTYIHTSKSDEKIRRAATGFTAEKQTDFPGAKHGEEWLRKQREEQIKDSGDVMFGVDFETQGLRGDQEVTLRKYEDLVDLQLNDTQGPEIIRRKRPEVIIDDKPYPTTEEMKKYIDEQCNKNVSQDEDKKDPGDYYKYSTIIKRMDDTHTRKNNDYGDAAYQGYKKYGDYYFLVQLHNKMSRLESLTVGRKTQMVKDESIDDTLLDLANYAIMFLESRHRND